MKNNNQKSLTKNDVRDVILDFWENVMDKYFTKHVEKRFDKMDERFDRIDHTLERIEDRLDRHGKQLDNHEERIVKLETPLG